MDIDLTGLIKLVNRANIDYELTPAVARDTTNKEQSIEPVPGSLPPPMVGFEAKQEGAANIGAVRMQFPPAGVKQNGPRKIWPDLPAHKAGHGFWGSELEEGKRMGLLDDLRHRIEVIETELVKIVQDAPIPEDEKKQDLALVNSAGGDLRTILDKVVKTSDKMEYYSFPGHDRGWTTGHSGAGGSGIVYNEKLMENAWASLKQGLDYPGISKLGEAMVKLKEMIGAYVSASTDPIQGVKPLLATGPSEKPVAGHP